LDKDRIERLVGLPEELQQGGIMPLGCRLRVLGCTGRDQSIDYGEIR